MGKAEREWGIKYLVPVVGVVLAGLRLQLFGIPGNSRWILPQNLDRHIERRPRRPMDR